MKKLLTALFATLTIFAGVLIIRTLVIIAQDNEEFKMDFSSSSKCEAQKEIELLHLRSVVDSVYVDTDNHSLKTLILNTKGNLHKLYLNHDRSELFHFIREKDSILKNLNTDSVFVKRGNFKKCFKIDYGCDND
ncbi:MAG: hypothetical protein ABJH05_19125 [Fulvivirga sp.]